MVGPIGWKLEWQMENLTVVCGRKSKRSKKRKDGEAEYSNLLRWQVSQCWANQLKAPRGDTWRICMKLVKEREWQEETGERILPASCGHGEGTRKENGECTWIWVWSAEICWHLKSGEIWHMVKSEIWLNLTSGEIWHLAKSDTWWNLTSGEI